MKQARAKRVSDKTWLGGEGNLLGIVQEIEIRPYYQIVNAQTRNS